MTASFADSWRISSAVTGMFRMESARILRVSFSMAILAMTLPSVSGDLFLFLYNRSFLSFLVPIGPESAFVLASIWVTVSGRFFWWFHPSALFFSPLSVKLITEVGLWCFPTVLMIRFSSPSSSSQSRSKRSKPGCSVKKHFVWICLSPRQTWHSSSTSSFRALP